MFLQSLLWRSALGHRVCCCLCADLEDHAVTCRGFRRCRGSGGGRPDDPAAHVGVPGSLQSWASLGTGAVLSARAGVSSWPPRVRVVACMSLWLRRPLPRMCVARCLGCARRVRPFPSALCHVCPCVCGLFRFGGLEPRPSGTALGGLPCLSLPFCPHSVQEHVGRDQVRASSFKVLFI